MGSKIEKIIDELDKINMEIQPGMQKYSIPLIMGGGFAFTGIITDNHSLAMAGVIIQNAGLIANYAIKVSSYTNRVININKLKGELNDYKL